MRAKNRAAVGGLALLCALAWSTSASAQDAVLSELYGAGVHRYFAGQYSQAVSSLSAAIDGGSKDPRVYYFRALAEMKMGWDGNARMDMQMGAALEVADGGAFPVAKSLERIQGSTRQTLEKYRALARNDAFQRQQLNNSVRYDSGPVLAPGSPTPAAQPPAMGRPVPPPVQPAPPTMPDEENNADEDEDLPPAGRTPPPVQPGGAPPASPFDDDF